MNWVSWLDSGSGEWLIVEDWITDGEDRQSIKEW